jgi:hypothetical protein
VGCGVLSCRAFLREASRIGTAAAEVSAMSGLGKAKCERIHFVEMKSPAGQRGLVHCSGTEVGLPIFVFKNLLLFRVV